MSDRLDLLQQCQFGPAKPCDRLDVPFLLLDCQLRLQNDHVLRPADGHGFGQHLRHVLIGSVELPHSAQIPGREAGDVRICAVQVLRFRDSGAFLRSFTDQPANPTVQLYLRQIVRHQRVQRRKQGAVIYGLSDVHPTSSFPARVRLFYSLPRSKSLNLSQFKDLDLSGCFSLFPFQFHHLLPLDDETVVDHFVLMIMPQEPAIEPAPFHYRLEEIRQPVGSVVFVEFGLDAGGSAVGQDAIHLPAGPFQVPDRASGGAHGAGYTGVSRRATDGQANICQQNVTVFDLRFATLFIDRDAVAMPDEITLAKHTADDPQPARRNDTLIGKNDLKPRLIHSVQPPFCLGSSIPFLAIFSPSR